MATLFQIGEDLRALSDLLDERGGDVTEADVAAAVDAWFQEVGDAQAEKLDRYVNLIRRQEMHAAAAKAEAEQYAAISAARDNEARRLKDRLKLFLELTGQQKVQTATGRSIWVQPNGGTPLVTDPAIDPASIPDDLAKVTRTFDRDKVIEALKGGRGIPFARFGERGTHLRIR